MVYPRPWGDDQKAVARQIHAAYQAAVEHAKNDMPFKTTKNAAGPTAAPTQHTSAGGAAGQSMQAAGNLASAINQRGEVAPSAAAERDAASSSSAVVTTGNKAVATTEDKIVAPIDAYTTAAHQEAYRFSALGVGEDGVPINFIYHESGKPAFIPPEHWSRYGFPNHPARAKWGQLALDAAQKLFGYSKDSLAPLFTTPGQLARAMNMTGRYDAADIQGQLIFYIYAELCKIADLTADHSLLYRVIRLDKFLHRLTYGAITITWATSTDEFRVLLTNIREKYVGKILASVASGVEDISVVEYTESALNKIGSLRDKLFKLLTNILRGDNDTHPWDRTDIQSMKASEGQELPYSITLLQALDAKLTKLGKGEIFAANERKLNGLLQQLEEQTDEGEQAVANRERILRDLKEILDASSGDLEYVTSEAEFTGLYEKCLQDPSIHRTFRKNAIAENQQGVYESLIFSALRLLVVLPRLEIAYKMLEQLKQLFKNEGEKGAFGTYWESSQENFGKIVEGINFVAKFVETMFKQFEKEAKAADFNQPAMRSRFEDCDTLFSGSKALLNGIASDLSTIRSEMVKWHYFYEAMAAQSDEVVLRNFLSAIIVPSMSNYRIGANNSVTMANVQKLVAWAGTHRRAEARAIKPPVPEHRQELPPHERGMLLMLACNLCNLHAEDQATLLRIVDIFEQYPEYQTRIFLLKGQVLLGDDQAKMLYEAFTNFQRMKPEDLRMIRQIAGTPYLSIAAAAPQPAPTRALLTERGETEFTDTDLGVCEKIPAGCDSFYEAIANQLEQRQGSSYNVNVLRQMVIQEIQRDTSRYGVEPQDAQDIAVEGAWATKYAVEALARRLRVCIVVFDVKATSKRTILFGVDPQDNLEAMTTLFLRYEGQRTFGTLDAMQVGHYDAVKANQVNNPSWDCQYGVEILQAVRMPAAVASGVVTPRDSSSSASVHTVRRAPTIPAMKNEWDTASVLEQATSAPSKPSAAKVSPPAASIPAMASTSSAPVLPAMKNEWDTASVLERSAGGPSKPAAVATKTSGSSLFGLKLDFFGISSSETRSVASTPIVASAPAPKTGPVSTSTTIAPASEPVRVPEPATSKPPVAVTTPAPSLYGINSATAYPPSVSSVGDMFGGLNLADPWNTAAMPALAQPEVRRPLQPEARRPLQPSTSSLSLTGNPWGGSSSSSTSALATFSAPRAGQPSQTGMSLPAIPGTGAIHARTSDSSSQNGSFGAAPPVDDTASVNTAGSTAGVHKPRKDRGGF